MVVVVGLLVDVVVVLVDVVLSGTDTDDTVDSFCPAKTQITLSHFRLRYYVRKETRANQPTVRNP